MPLYDHISSYISFHHFLGRKCLDNYQQELILKSLKMKIEL
jgi:hypothetical protein